MIKNKLRKKAMKKKPKPKSEKTSILYSIKKAIKQK